MRYKLKLAIYTANTNYLPEWFGEIVVVCQDSDPKWRKIWAKNAWDSFTSGFHSWCIARDDELFYLGDF